MTKALVDVDTALPVPATSDVLVADNGITGDFTFSVYGLNVLQKEYFYTKANNLASLGTETGVPAPGSEWGVEVTYNFR